MSTVVEDGSYPRQEGIAYRQHTHIAINPTNNTVAQHLFSLVYDTITNQGDVLMETTTTPDVGYTKTAINGFFEGLTVLLTATAKTSGKVAKVAVDGFKEGYNSNIPQPDHAKKRKPTDAHSYAQPITDNGSSVPSDACSV